MTNLTIIQFEFTKYPCEKYRYYLSVRAPLSL